ncbi:hypothetical protein [Streptomyces sp. NBC_01465]|uniref:hypothetical protein n=1 Tax=Streptomyces sp. NBC_01465 TaxID=2903878 RepID=UPI002E2FE77D|nr:hypothetical protein [Streptomyces sp. NBC_01465]
MIVSFVLAAVVLAAGGFLAGRASAPDGDAKAVEDCSKLQRLASDKHREAEALSSLEDQQDEWLDGIRTYGYLVKQNPDCFPAEDRAKAQATLDRYKNLNSG